MQFINKKIAILGFGEEGQDLMEWLKTNTDNCQITILDQDQSKGQVYEGQDLSRFDLIFRSPGFYRLNPMLTLAQKQGTVITSTTKLFFQLCPCPIIAVTGTKGKGTTATLITRILKSSGKTIYLAGNIGKPMLTLLPWLKQADFVCLELSSFQLQDLTQSPHLAVVLNITSEHLDFHRSVAEYQQAKLNLIRFQTKKDLAVINADYPFTQQIKTKAKKYYFSRYQKVKGAYVLLRKIYLNLNSKPVLIGSSGKLQLRGEHNWENITAAITASALSGASIAAIKKVVFRFKGLEHRLELVRELHQVKYYNDSFSTTPETAIAAIKAFKEPMIIILGGSDKGSDYTELGKTISQSKNIKAVILIGKMGPIIGQSIKAVRPCRARIIQGKPTFPEIINQAYQLAQPKDVVVLSPACASFDMFQNYKERGNQFKTYVKNYL
ncbi:MAG: UDP-N-acetylmuramoyl-L-alanine--D-glutamate ligase [Candidatus Beckwithbacteria bacterium]